MQGELQGKKLQLLNFINQLIEDPEFIFCVDLDPFAFGMLDAPFIMDENILSLQEIKDLLKSKKKVSMKAVFNELRKMFEGISDYVLSSDPLQLSCQTGMKKVNQFEYSLMQRNNYTYEDSVSDTTSFRSTIKSNNSRPLSFLQQLQMAFYLINLDSNDQVIREIGEKYSILEETEEQYILNLSKSNSWAPLITKTSDPQ